MSIPIEQQRAVRNVRMDTPYERLRAIREQRGFETARDAARAYGWQISAYAHHENGTRGIPPDAAIKYAKAFRFSLDWLYRGLNDSNSKGVRALPYIAQKVIPRLSWDFVKVHGGVESAMENAAEFVSVPKHVEIAQPAFSMICSGDSMKNAPGQSPSFEDGETLIFSTRDEPRPGDFVLAELYAENVVVFRQYRERTVNEDGFLVYELAALNPAHRSYIVTQAGQARIVAKMTHSIKTY